MPRSADDLQYFAFALFSGEDGSLKVADDRWMKLRIIVDVLLDSGMLSDRQVLAYSRISREDAIPLLRILCKYQFVIVLGCSYDAVDARFWGSMFFRGGPGLRHLREHMQFWKDFIDAVNTA